MLNRFKLYTRELSDFSRLFDQANRHARRLVFYSERDMYYQYFEGLITHLLEHSDVEFCYVTSDPNDPQLACRDPRMKVFYINRLLPSMLNKLEARALVMTMPDLNHFHLKRSPGTRNHIYMFHALISTHLAYRTRAFEHYDTIFCCGPHHVRELRREEEVYGLKPRTLVETGYYRLEKIYRDHQAYRQTHLSSGSRTTVLVAPTWGESSILELRPDELVRALASTDCDVVIRPHPEFLKREPKKAAHLQRLVAATSNVTLETDLVSGASIHSADILITDRSGIAFEYAFGTERPVLFVDTPLKINNPEYGKLELEPIEISSRNSMGVAIGVEELNRIPQVLKDFSEQEGAFRERIRTCREGAVFNWLGSAKIEAEYILSLLRT